MPIDSLPVILEKYFYPNQEIRALLNYDKNGDKQNNSTHISRTADAVGSEKGKYALQLDLTLDIDKSVNPPYEVHLTIVGIFRVKNTALDELEMRKQVFDSGTDLLIGALRERLVMLTHSGPWGAFYLNFIDVQPITNKEIDLIVPAKSGKAATVKQATRKKASKKKSSIKK